MKAIVLTRWIEGKAVERGQLNTQTGKEFAMLSLIADAMMTATRTRRCGGWSECQQGGPARPYPCSPRQKEWDAPKTWYDRAGQR